MLALVHPQLHPRGCWRQSQLAYAHTQQAQNTATLNRQQQFTVIEKNKSKASCNKHVIASMTTHSRVCKRQHCPCPEADFGHCHLPDSCVSDSLCDWMTKALQLPKRILDVDSHSSRNNSNVPMQCHALSKRELPQQSLATICLP